MEAVRREAREELDLDVRIECILGTSHFYRGEMLPENEMVGVVFGCSVDEPTGLRLSDEHSAYRWVTLAEAQAFFPRGHLMTALIARADAVRGLMPDEFRQLQWKGDFEF